MFKSLVSIYLSIYLNRAARAGATYSKPSGEIFEELGWTQLDSMRQFHKAIMMFKIVNGLAPPYLTEMFTSNNALNLTIAV